MSWPAAKTIAAARLGHVALVISTPEGLARGLRSSTPHVWARMSDRGTIAGCDNCGARDHEPNPPGAGQPGESRKALLSPGTYGHSLFLLTWLNRFEKEHEHAQAEAE